MKSLLICLLLSLSLTSLAQNKPNVVLIMMDDLGYGDLSCYGASEYATPQIDQMAKNGVRFTHFLSAQAVCSASRAGLLTGCYPNRIGISGALFPNSKIGINASEETIAELLHSNGYVTGMFGKWHLGDRKDFLPMQHGFDEYVGIPYSNDMWPVDYDGQKAIAPSNKSRFPLLPLIRNNEPEKYIETLDDQAQLIQILTKESVQFIEKNKSKPFFLYLPHPMPHVPINASKDFRGKSKQGLFGDVMMEMDWSVGEILATLKKHMLEKNTIVIFTSDNGPWQNFGNHAGSTGGLREAKGSSFEGGQRVPFIVQWKGHLPEGKVQAGLASNIDLLPTICALTQSPLPQKKIDGVNIQRLMEGSQTAEPRKSFYYYYRTNNLEAVRKGNWKLVFAHPGRTHEGFLPGKDGYPGKLNEDFAFNQGLYDLRRDPGERYDVSAMYPEIVAELEALGNQAREDLGDDLKSMPGTGKRMPGKRND
ncbi:MAG: sulfatase [Bacteroidota bacterium]